MTPREPEATNEELPEEEARRVYVPGDDRHARLVEELRALHGSDEEPES